MLAEATAELRHPARPLIKLRDDAVRGLDVRVAYLWVRLDLPGGPLALVQNGDMIELDVAGRRLHLEVSDEELAERRKLWVAPEAPKRGYQKLYVETVQQAHLGADLDFLVELESEKQSSFNNSLTM